jgi:GMP synthase (glutamine-hydrolysing)
VQGYRTGLAVAEQRHGQSDDRYVLIIQHVPWEAPGAIATALEGVPTRTISVASDPKPPLPTVDELAGLVVMGGPMAADDTVGFPGLAAERDLLASAVEASVPALGICLGAQLLGLALGADLERGVSPELGWAPVEVHAKDDPCVAGLTDGVSVLHWHSDAISLPPGAELLASTWTTPVQAFRKANAWGLQFHLEVTDELLAVWVANDVMAAEAAEALGPDWRSTLTGQGEPALRALEPFARRSLAAFARLVQAAI